MASCSIIGHREFKRDENKIEKLKKLIADLILNKNVDIFLFSSKSEFVDEVWEIVSSLQSTGFPSIKMVAYDCRNESSILKTEKETVEKRISKILNKEIKFQYFDEVIKCEKSYNSGKNAYIIRNQQIIDESDICLFYYDPSYTPPHNEKHYHTKKSGTMLAYQYALRKKRPIINFFELSETPPASN